MYTQCVLQLKSILRDLVGMKHKVACLLGEKKIACKAQGKSFTSMIAYTKATKAKSKEKKANTNPGAVVGGVAKMAFPAVNASPISNILPVQRRTQAHPGNNKHLKIQDMEYCHICNRHLAKGKITSHCNSQVHATAAATNVFYDYCNTCSCGHIRGAVCPALLAGATGGLFTAGDICGWG